VPFVKGQSGNPKGRPKGKMRSAREIADSLGVDPLAFLLGLVDDVAQPMDLRVDCAKACVPYLHPRLNSSDVKASGSFEVLSHAEIEERLRRLLK